MNDLEKKIQFAVSLFKLKKYNEAQNHAEKLIAQYPRVIFLYNILGLIYTEKKEIDLAIKTFNKGLDFDPNQAMIYNNLGTAYKIKEDYKKSELSYKKSIDIDRNIPETHNNFGNFYLELNNYTKAVECFKKAILVNEKFYIAYYNLGVAYKGMGKFDDAKKYLKDAIKLNPNFFTAHRILSQILNYDIDNKHFDILKSIFQNKKDEIGIGEIAFSLGKAYEDLKDYNNSFKYFNIGNQKKRKSINFSLTKEKESFEMIKNSFNKDMFKKFLNSGCKNPSVIFIVGMPRSGTTLVEQILSNHSKVYGGDELNILPDLINKYFNNKKFVNIEKDHLEIVGKDYIDKLNQISKNSLVKTDKLTENFKWIGLIKLILPNSKIIHCTRNSKDVCFSIFKNYFTNNKLNFAYDIDEIVSYYNFYFNLMNHWKKILPNFIYDINYENLINKNESEIKNLLEFCKLDWDQNCIKFYNNKRTIKTASDVQVRKKIYNSSINYWKNFKNNLDIPFKKLLN